MKFSKPVVKENEAAAKLLRTITIICFSILPTAAFMIDLGMHPKNIVNYIIFGVSAFFINKAFKIRDKQIKIIAFAVGVIYASFMTFGNYTANCKSIFTFAICFFGFFIIFESAAIVLLQKTLTVSLYKDGKRENIKKVFFLSLAIMLLAWLPYFLAFFPGFTTDDSINQLKQVTGAEPWMNWHPVFHTLIIKATYSLGLALSGGNQTAGIAVYTVVQLAFTGLVFAYFITTLYRFKIHKKAILASLLFFVLFPIVPIYNMTMWKDVWFAGFVLAFLVTLWRLLKHFEESKTKNIPVFEGIMFFVLAVCVCLSRSNGYYAFLLTIPFLIIAFRKKTLKVALIVVLAFVVAFVVKGPVYSACNIAGADVLETIGVPVQHICGAITDGAELTSEEEEFVNEILPVETIKKVYDKNSVDPIKMTIRNEGNLHYLETHKKEFIILWVHLGARNPMSYLKAQVNQTYGYWYPDVTYWILPWFDNGGFDFCQKSLLPQGTGDLLLSLNVVYNIPVISAFWSLGLYTWILLGCFFISVFKKRGSDWVIFILPLAILFSLMLATPVFAEFRYAYSIVVSMPLFVILPFAKKEEVKNE